jgi:hypothetical protein
MKMSNRRWRKIMSEQEIYEIARRRIDKRNRRWTLWGIDLAGLILAVSALILLGETVYVNFAAAIFMAWAGVFVLHTIVAALGHSRDSDIESEAAKLRGAVYEKPKRLELTDDGELVDLDDWEGDNAKVKRGM